MNPDGAMMRITNNAAFDYSELVSESHRFRSRPEPLRRDTHLGHES